MASRVQPVVASNRLFIGSMDDAMYARNASTGAPLWKYTTGGPIRNSAGVTGSMVIFSSFDGYTYALDAGSGALLWRTNTGSSATAPLLTTTVAYVASTNGLLSALNITSGALLWQYNSGAAILTSPTLSADGQVVLFGNEAIHAIAVNASNGQALWTTPLQGQSLGDRYPVVVGS